MPPLNNARHEAFVRGLLENLSADEAFVKAGFKRNRGNASRLKSNENISRRLSELQAEAAANAEVTVASICKELDAANEVARQKGQAAAMVSAATLRAKLSGLMVEKMEITTNDRLDRCGDTAAELADALLNRLVDGFRPIDARDRQGLMDILSKQAKETAEFLQAIHARPIIAEKVDPAALPPDWQSLRLHSALPRRITNGSK
jgi:hypothetical protein